MFLNNKELKNKNYDINLNSNLYHSFIKKKINSHSSRFSKPLTFTTFVVHIIEISKQIVLILSLLVILYCIFSENDMFNLTKTICKSGRK